MTMYNLPNMMLLLSIGISLLAPEVASFEPHVYSVRKASKASPFARTTHSRWVAPSPTSVSFSTRRTAQFLFNRGENKKTMEEVHSETTDAIPSFNFWRQHQAVMSEDEGQHAVEDTSGMPDLISFLQPKRDQPNQLADDTNSVLATESTESTAIDIKTFAIGFGAVLVTAVVAACTAFGISPDDVIHAMQSFFANPQASLQQLLTTVESAGNAGPLYFGILYFLAEILAIPATPLTMSAGFLFGTVNGSITVLIAATFAACFGFVVGKTVLRGTVENILNENPKYAKLDNAIGEKGFPLLLLVRLTPLFPFSLSNYVYGASSIRFRDYFWGTLLGFAPGTVAYVYTGKVGQALTTGEGGQPWYVYVGGLVALAGVLKLVTDVATNIVQAMEEEDE